jgi:sirohydrochlorin ferrochelatase
MTALVLAAHGTASAAGRATVEAIAARVRLARPSVPVRLCYVDVGSPRRSDVLGRMTGSAVVVPLLLSTGYHVRRDIPAAVSAYPRLRAVITPTLGPDPLLAEALADRLRQAGWRGRRPVVLGAAGSRDPAAASQVAQMAGLLAAFAGVPVHPAAHASGVEDVLAAVRRLDPHAAVSTYLVADGYFASRIAATGALTSAPIGAHPALARLVVRRYDEGLASTGPRRKADLGGSGVVSSRRAASGAGHPPTGAARG